MKQPLHKGAVLLIKPAQPVIQAVLPKAVVNERTGSRAPHSTAVRLAGCEFAANGPAVLKIQRPFSLVLAVMERAGISKRAVRMEEKPFPFLLAVFIAAAVEYAAV